MSAPRNVNTLLYACRPLADGRWELTTKAGKFRTASNSEAGHKARCGEWPAGTPVVLHIWTRGTVVKILHLR